MKKNYGHYKQTNIRKLMLKNKQFTKFWKINKNNITTCKDCEFRFVCVDCRVNIEDKNDILSKPSMCNYNPYMTI
jgi:radical SAM protein with 4Fe4S-binding SPASM domain